MKAAPASLPRNLAAYSSLSPHPHSCLVQMYKIHLHLIAESWIKFVPRSPNNGSPHAIRSRKYQARRKPRRVPIPVSELAGEDDDSREESGEPTDATS